MDKQKVDKIASEVKKYFCDLLIELSRHHNCVIIAEVVNLKVYEKDKENGIEVK